MERKWSFWPMLDEPTGDRPEQGYGPITAEWIEKGEIVGPTVYEEAEAMLPDPPAGCWWGLVGMTWEGSRDAGAPTVAEVVVSEVECPNCGAEEMHPDGDKLLIRGHKVHDEGRWWSQCLVCAGYYTKDLVFDEAAGDPNGGWF